MGQVTDALRSSGLQLFFFNLITITLHRLLLLFKQTTGSKNELISTPILPESSPPLLRR